MAPYLAAVRNYWSLLPAIAVCVGLLLLYAVPTLINPRWTGTVLRLFRQSQDADGDRPEQGPRQIRSQRMLAAALVACALALVGFNISLNREANGCYQAARAWGAVDSDDRTKDPCLEMIYGRFFGDGGGNPTESSPQPVPAYQVVEGNKPKYLRWIHNRPSYDDLDFVVGVGGNCALDLKVVQGEDKITVLSDTSEPCPPDTSVAITSVKLAKPLGDREIVTVGDKPMQRIDPDLDSWGTVLKKLVTGG
jgi:hypothetical protein